MFALFSADGLAVWASRAQEIAKQLATEDGALPVIRALDRLSDEGAGRCHSTHPAKRRDIRGMNARRAG